MRVIDPGPLTTVQDLGRFGFGRYGVPASGAMDWFALRAANLLVGNEPGEAGLEIGLGDVTLEATEDRVVAVAGAGYDLWIRERPRPLWLAMRVCRGWTVELRKRAGGTWAYLAIAGGVKTPKVLGSRATYVRGRLGGLAGRPLQGGDTLPIGPASKSLFHLAGRELAGQHRPRYHDSITADVIWGPQADHFSDQGRQVLLSSEFTVSASSDRMGYRLEGPAIGHVRGADIVSDGMVPGSLQVPANGQPLLMMADGPPTGGYPKIAVVVSADLPLLAQCTPGAGRMRFREATIEAAQRRYREMMGKLKSQMESQTWCDGLEIGP